MVSITLIRKENYLFVSIEALDWITCKMRMCDLVSMSQGAQIPGKLPEVQVG